jgi:type II secretory pathway component PulF
MSNTSSTYLGLVAGAAIGGVISWWVYYRQNKTSRKQDHVLYLIEQIERKNGKILKHLESYAKHHDLVLNKILLLEESIQALNKKIESKEEDPHS